MPAEQLGAEAVETGHTDLGVKGLHLITEAATPAAGRKVLEEVMSSRTDDLAREAARILRENHDPVEIAALALEAAWDTLRLQAVHWLSADYQPEAGENDQTPRSMQAQKQLAAALGSRYRPVRKAAAIELARKKDAAAFEALVELLKETPTAAIVEALETLGDPRTPAALLDRVENDPAGEAPAAELIKAAGRFRQKETAGRLLKMMEQHKLRSACHEALWSIAGYDQPNLENRHLMIWDAVRGWIFRDQVEGEDLIDPDWEQKQHPRHDDILARLMEKCLELGEANTLKYSLEQARWARGKEVDPILAVLAAHSDDGLRHDAVEALGWRLKHRGGSAEPLLKALEHRDPQTKFLAAEGLAKSGRNEGAGVLLSAMDLMEDSFLRQRAVLALGELADTRALDVLLRLAGEEGHALREAAAEALGHLGRSDKAEEIFKLLERLAKKEGGLAQSALRGLRWFDTPSGWKLVREKAEDHAFLFRTTAVELLAENDDPATRDLILKLLREDEEVWEEARGSARRLFGPDSLEPSYAVLQNEAFWISGSQEQRLLDRVCAEGEPSRIIEIFPQVKSEYQEPLASALLKRDTLPVEEAAEAIGSRQENAVDLAAHILGRAGAQANSHGEKVAEAVRFWRETWDDRRRERQPAWGGHPAESLTPRLCRLIWAAGRLGVAAKELLSAADSHTEDNFYRPVRLEAIRGTRQGKSGQARSENPGSGRGGARSRSPRGRGPGARRAGCPTGGGGGRENALGPRESGTPGDDRGGGCHSRRSCRRRERALSRRGPAGVDRRRGFGAPPNRRPKPGPAGSGPLGSRRKPRPFGTRSGRGGTRRHRQERERRGRIPQSRLAHPPPFPAPPPENDFVRTGEKTTALFPSPHPALSPKGRGDIRQLFFRRF